MFQPRLNEYVPGADRGAGVRSKMVIDRTTPTSRQRTRRSRALVLCGLTWVLMCGGYGPHSALDSAGPQAARIELLWWLFFWVCVVVWLLVMAFLLVPAFRRRRVALPTAADAP